MNDKKKIILGLSVVFVAVVGLGALHFFKIKSRGALLSEIEKFDKQASQLEERIKQIPGLREERDKLVEYVDDYIKILPREEHVQHDAFVEIINQYSMDTDIRIETAEYVPSSDKKTRSRRRNGADEETKQDFVRHRYKFRLRGTVPELVQFMHKIENHQRFLKVDALDLKPLGAGGDNDGRVSQDQEEEELELASDPRKEIELTVSTYTYYKDSQKQLKS